MPTVDSDVKLDYSDVLLLPKNSNLNSRKDVSLTINFMDVEVLPLIAANMDGVGTFKMAHALAKQFIMTALTKHYAIENLVNFYTEFKRDPAHSLYHISDYAIYSMGTTNDDWVKFAAVMMKLDGTDCEPRFVCIDVANGYTTGFARFIEKFVDTYPQVTLIAGNVVTPERVVELLDLGVSVVKVGIGPGSVCTTRKLTGIGYPQFSAVLECSAAARENNGRIIADGGCTCPGDIVKAFGAGADLVMLGGMLAGHDEGHVGQLYGDFTGGRVQVPFYGMASKEAQERHNGGVQDYRASEGKIVMVPYRGPVEHTIKEILGGLRSACTYAGSPALEDLWMDAKFIRVSRQTNEVFSAN